MGIYIPNMEKPKSCYECPIAKSYLDCLMEKKYVCPIGHTDDCPLIDIVTCGECKYWDKSVKGHIDVGDHLCRRRLRWTMERDFCSDGETETLDDRIKRGLKEMKPNLEWIEEWEENDETTVRVLADK